jgi:hypothetical protein
MRKYELTTAFETLIFVVVLQPTDSRRPASRSWPRSWPASAVSASFADPNVATQSLIESLNRTRGPSRRPPSTASSSFSIPNAGRTKDNRKSDSSLCNSNNRNNKKSITRKMKQILLSITY